VQLSAGDTTRTHSHLTVKRSTSTSATLSDTATAERRAAVRSKPPNILVYCGKKDSSRLFESVKTVLSEVVNTDQFIIYHLKHGQVLSTPWHDNASLLVIASDKVYDGVDRQFLEHFVRGGRLVSFGSAFDSALVKRRVREPGLSAQLGVVTLLTDGHESVSVIATNYCYDTPPESLLPRVTLTCLAADKLTRRPVIVEAVHESSAGVAILSQVSLSLSQPVCLSVSVSTVESWS